MEAPQLGADADVRSLPHGTKVGAWRLRGCAGLGVYGTVYRAVREGEEQGRVVALKLAIYRRDGRFKREAQLLRLIHHPSVPGLLDRGDWRHPNGFHHPFLVMEWIDGEPLYEWASVRNPSQRQVLRLLAQAARALHATHEVGGLHRDVKGDNTLVRPADERLFLTDFGAGHCVGAERLTSGPLPPGTPAYRSPEAWAHGRQLAPRRRGLYVAGPADDVFALGVMAYRLVTDEYPPFTDASMEEGRCWRPGGEGPLPPREVNPRVGPVLDATIRRMLSLKPEERGTPEALAREMERGAEQGGPEVDEALFEWETLEREEWPREELADAEQLGHRPLRRDREAVRAAAEADAAREAQRQQADAVARPAVPGKDDEPRACNQTRQVEPRAQSPVEQVEPRARSQAGHAVPQARSPLEPLGLMVAMLVMALLLWPREREPMSDGPRFTGVQGAPAEEGRDGGVNVGDSALTSAHPLEDAPGGKVVAVEVPPQPLPGQIKPDGKGRCRQGLVPINGGCWAKVPVADLEDCQSLRDGVVFRQGCYVPAFSRTREPTSAPLRSEGSER